MARLTGQGVTRPTAWMYENVLSHWTSPRWARRRVSLLRRHFQTFGRGSSLSFEVRLLDVHRISVGSHVSINNQCVLDGRGGLSIGDDSLIGFESVLLTSTHQFSDPETLVRLQGMWAAPVVVGRDVWLGCRVVVLPGVTIGDRAVVAAGSVVRSDVAPGAIVGGVPARPIGHRGGQ